MIQKEDPFFWNSGFLTFYVDFCSQHVGTLIFTVFTYSIVTFKIQSGIMILCTLNSLSANPKKCVNTLKQFAGNLPTNCLSGFDHFVGLALKRLKD